MTAGSMPVAAAAGLILEMSKGFGSAGLAFLGSLSKRREPRHQVAHLVEW